MTREEAHRLVDELFNAQEAPQPTISTNEASIDPHVAEVEAVEVADHTTPANKRIIRTKSQGDRVYQLDEEKKIRQWVTNPEVLKGLGWDMSDVAEIEDEEFSKYQMGPAIYKIED